MVVSGCDCGCTCNACVCVCLCVRYNRPPWVSCELESKELLALCLKKVQGLNKVKLVDAGFVWTEVCVCLCMGLCTWRALCPVGVLQVCVCACVCTALLGALPPC